MPRRALHTLKNIADSRQTCVSNPKALRIHQEGLHGCGLVPKWMASCSSPPMVSIWCFPNAFGVHWQLQETHEICFFRVYEPRTRFPFCLLWGKRVWTGWIFRLAATNRSRRRCLTSRSRHARHIGPCLALLAIACWLATTLKACGCAFSLEMAAEGGFSKSWTSFWMMTERQVLDPL